MQFRIYRARETELIEGCRRQDPAAQAAIYRTMAGKMYAVCCRYVRDRMEAEDVLVTSFTKVFERIGQFKGEGSFEGWVRRIIVNESLTYLRKNKGMYVESDLSDAEHAQDPSSMAQAMEAEDLLKLVADLPAGYRMVFNLYAIEGYSHQEIALQLGISENTSKSQLSRARSHLQAKLLALEQEVQLKSKEQ